MRIWVFYFSPTGGTRRAAELLTEGLPGEVFPISMTVAQPELPGIALKQEDLAILAVPSYAGRVPSLAAQRLSKLFGNDARAVLLCAYGNRAYEDTLVELEDLARQAGFRVVAGVAAVTEHSIARQFATGRPDADDAAKLRDFAARIAKKLADGDDSEPALPGNRPYKKAGAVSLVPHPTADCNGCGLCARQCPAQAIDPHNTHRVNASACLSCMRCVAVCPRHARKVPNVLLSALGLALKKVCSDRKEPELFL